MQEADSGDDWFFFILFVDHQDINRILRINWAQATPIPSLPAIPPAGGTPNLSFIAFANFLDGVARASGMTNSNYTVDVNHRREPGVYGGVQGGGSQIHSSPTSRRTRGGWPQDRVLASCTGWRRWGQPPLQSPKSLLGHSCKLREPWVPRPNIMRITYICFLQCVSTSPDGYLRCNVVYICSFYWTLNWNIN